MTRYLIILTLILFSCTKEPLRDTESYWCGWETFSVIKKTGGYTIQMQIDYWGIKVMTPDLTYEFNAKDIKGRCAIDRVFVVYWQDDNRQWRYLGWGTVDVETLIEMSYNGDEITTNLNGEFKRVTQ